MGENLIQCQNKLLVHEGRHWKGSSMMCNAVKFGSSPAPSHPPHLEYYLSTSACIAKSHGVFMYDTRNQLATEGICILPSSAYYIVVLYLPAVSHPTINSRKIGPYNY